MRRRVRLPLAEFPLAPNVHPPRNVVHQLALGFCIELLDSNRVVLAYVEVVGNDVALLVRRRRTGWRNITRRQIETRERFVIEAVDIPFEIDGGTSLGTVELHVGIIGFVVQLRQR